MVIEREIIVVVFVLRYLCVANINGMNSNNRPLFFDITTWNEKRFYQTKGTRDKCIVQKPDDYTYYYFKTSFNQGERNYMHEFWSEIVASFVGKYLGFSTLEYHIAKKGDKIGCLSKQMNENNSSLIEGMSLLTGYDNSYNAKSKKSYNRYTLEFIYEALSYYSVRQADFNKMIIFDFIIGNSDRHQENWGFISYTRTDFLHNMYIFVRNKRKLSSILKKITPSTIKSKITRNFVNSQYNEFAPIYDSGSSLVRELSDEKIDLTLSNRDMFNGIINRARSEIRKNNGDKFKQIDIVKEVLHKDPETFYLVGEYLKNRVDLKVIKEIIYNIDKSLPEALLHFCLPENRKHLIYELISERINLLKKIIR